MDVETLTNSLLLSLVAVVCIAAVTLLGSNISTMLSNLASKI